MATTILAPAPASCNANGATLTLTVTEAAERYHLHNNSIRRYCDSGKLPHLTTPGGHRRIRVVDLERVFGLSGDNQKEDGVSEGNGTRRVACLGRVSGAFQGRNTDTTTNGKRDENGAESDLYRQIETLKNYAKEKYDCGNPDMYCDIGGGLSYSRPNFVRLLESICKGEYNGGVVIASYRDRIARWAVELVELICRCHNVQLDIINTTEEVSDLDNESLSESIIAIMTHFSAVTNGRKSAKNNTMTLTPEAIEKAKELKDSGYPLQKITEILRHCGFTQTNGRGEVRAITVWTVGKLFDNGQGELLEVALPKNEDEEAGTSFHKWVAMTLEVTGNENDKVTVSDLTAKYEEYCKLADEVPVSKVTIGKVLKAKAIRRFRSSGDCKYSGLKMKA